MWNYLTLAVHRYRAESGKIYLVLDYCENVLSKLLRDVRHVGMGPADCKWLMYQLLHATSYLHEHKVRMSVTNCEAPMQPMVGYQICTWIPNMKWLQVQSAVFM